MASNFKELLAKKVDDAERPKVLPAGTYEGVVKGHEFGESSQKKTPYVEFTYTITAPGDDIPAEDLEGVNFQGKTLRSSFFFTPDAEWRLKEFIKSCGVETDGKAFGETIPDCTGAPVLLSVVQQPSRTAEGEFYNAVGKVIGAAI